MTDEQQTYIILGGTGSIGSAVVRQLAVAGANLVVGARDFNKASQIAEEFQGDAHQVEADDSASIEACVKATLERHGKITGVANCIGSVLLKPAHMTSDEEWHHTITTNLTSSFSLVRAATKAMRKTGGSIVLVSSAAAQIGLSNHEAIAAAKAGIIGLTLSAAATYSTRGIRVNAVAPGLVRSAMTRKLWETDGAEAMSAQMHALGRLGAPEDVARAIVWLLDPCNSWVTGQTIGVDGGLGSVLTRMKM
ncbi:MAG: SDR family oxidoreductase [Fuerstiella sp.]|jgi:NAD(P)-dependent dehydrogenase (short-subunit alcohol dehydrogenase family)|nr:SDR family oxidoreductase [Fuerstiella sp.]